MFYLKKNKRINKTENNDFGIEMYFRIILFYNDSSQRYK